MKLVAWVNFLVSLIRKIEIKIIKKPDRITIILLSSILVIQITILILLIIQ